MDHQLMARHGDAMEAELKAAGGVSMGTTIMAVTYDGGVVLGADSRTSTGAYIANRATDKVTRIADTIFLCRSGSAADTQALAAAAATHLAALGVELGREPTVGQAARVLARMAYSNKDALQAGMIVAGVDPVEGGVVYALPLGGTLLSVPYAVGGSGSAYISGLCDKHWRPGMDRDAAVAFVRRAVAAAMARDGSSGGCIRTVAVDAAGGVERGFVPGDAVSPSFGDLPLVGAAAVAAS